MALTLHLDLQTGQPDKPCSEQPTKQSNDVPACPNDSYMAFSNDLATIRGDEATSTHTAKYQSFAEDRMYEAHDEG